MTNTEVHAIVAAMAPSPRAELRADTRLVADLAYDSVRLIELSIALERHFALAALDESRLAAVTTVGDVVDLVAEQLAAGDLGAGDLGAVR
ncbi:acyl carrier protein [Kutzneria sp. CA-103260]|uniref:acyl carrier protein n=1 Tax=Kutzneria sp. CA-103260 TaxID=2802641 RepID=UPI001BABE43D|nr:acyl carrier protein [Kutzneria sp. CA-103260]QUQ63033.1 Acyl carrier protein [Kutzneria sp. CA-103260]